MSTGIRDRDCDRVSRCAMLLFRWLSCQMGPISLVVVGYSPQPDGFASLALLLPGYQHRPTREFSARQWCCHCMPRRRRNFFYFAHVMVPFQIGHPIGRPIVRGKSVIASLVLLHCAQRPFLLHLHRAIAPLAPSTHGYGGTPIAAPPPVVKLTAITLDHFIYSWQRRIS
jgi:hypothetical protein